MSNTGRACDRAGSASVRQIKSYRVVLAIATRMLLLAGALSVIVGCATIGHKFDPALADQLTPGVSSIEDAVHLLGKPSAESNLEGGQKILQWLFVQSTAFGTGSGDRLAILFDEKGMMVRVTFRSHQTLH